MADKTKYTSLSGKKEWCSKFEDRFGKDWSYYVVLPIKNEEGNEIVFIEIYNHKEEILDAYSPKYDTFVMSKSTDILQDVLDLF